VVAPGGGPRRTAPIPRGVSFPPGPCSPSPLLHYGLHLLVLVPAPQHQPLQLAAPRGIACGTPTKPPQHPSSSSN